MIKYLSQLSFWNDLDKSEKEFLINNASIRKYEKGSMIHSSESSCLGMIYVLKGSIRVSVISEEGREITLFKINRDEQCVLSASCVISQISFDTHMTAQQDCEVLVIGSSAFQRIMQQNIYVKCFTYELMTKRFSTVMWTMQQILFFKLDQRLASFLVDEYDKTGKTEIYMTQEQIAQHINSAREVVARMLKRFSADGLVELKRGYILLKKVDELREL